MPAATFFPRVQVTDSDSPHDGQTVALLVVDGTVRVNPADVPGDATVVAFDGLHVSPGWTDFGAALHEPGHEEKETVDSLLAAAAAGGYTRVLAFPNTDPVVDDASALRGVLAHVNDDYGVQLELIPALSSGARGEQLAAIGELAEAGARFVGDGLDPVRDPKLLQLALTYAQPFGTAVVVQPGQSRLEAGGQMHEGAVSTSLGLPGVPAMAEEIGVSRDLRLLDYRGGRLHLYALSLEASIREAAFAKTRGADLTYGVACLNLLLTDEALVNYDATAKVQPPLRPAAEREALREAIRSGQADALVSNHRPQDMESHRVEFPYASPGAATLELAFAIAATAVGPADAVAYLAGHNRRLCGAPPATVVDGAAAELTFYLPNQAFEVPPQALRSAGVNVPVVGRRLSGVPAGTLVGSVWRESPWLRKIGVIT